MSVRTEQTLRRMWDESIKLSADAAQYRADSGECFTAAQAHARAAAEATAAAAAETAAADSAEQAARAKHAIAQGKEAEADDLRDLVNRERTEAGLAPLGAGEPYPVDPAPAGQPTADDTLVASAQSSVETATDGHLDTREVGS